MLTLCGFAASNYYNKVKLALMEKSIPFQEELVWVGKDAVVAGSLLGKVPFLKTPQGILTESEVILEYLEDAYPEKPLLPKDPFERAKVREVATYLNLHLELNARELYLEAFFGGKISDEVKATTEKRLKTAIEGFNKIAKYSPFVAGDQFTIADCSAVVHLTLITMASKIIYGVDFLEGTPARDYVKRMNAMPSMVKINEDRKVNTELMMSLRNKK
jgi:glutathione S-transferase